MHFTLGNLVLRPDFPQKQRRIRVVLLPVFLHHRIIEVSIAVAAAVAAGIVGADINAFHAAAFQALVLVLAHLHRAAEQLFEKTAVDAVRMLNAVLLQLDAFGAGCQLQAVAVHNLGSTFFKDQ